jgi:hypothetical protein
LRATPGIIDQQGFKSPILKRPHSLIIAGTSTYKAGGAQTPAVKLDTVISNNSYCKFHQPRARRTVRTKANSSIRNNGRSLLYFFPKPVRKCPDSKNAEPELAYA